MKILRSLLRALAAMLTAALLPLAAQPADVLYYENIEGGHGGAANNKQSAYMNALAYTFLLKQLQ